MINGSLKTKHGVCERLLLEWSEWYWSAYNCTVSSYRNPYSRECSHNHSQQFDSRKAERVRRICSRSASRLLKTDIFIWRSSLRLFKIHKLYLAQSIFQWLFFNFFTEAKPETVVTRWSVRPIVWSVVIGSETRTGFSDVRRGNIAISGFSRSLKNDTN